MLYEVITPNITFRVAMQSSWFIHISALTVFVEIVFIFFCGTIGFYCGNISFNRASYNFV